MVLMVWPVYIFAPLSRHSRFTAAQLNGFGTNVTQKHAELIP